jgi:tRNA(fMet)-specific endonuclease VapC
VRYLLDTNHCSYIQRGAPSVVRRLMSLQADDEIALSVVAQGELLAGIEQKLEVTRRAELRRLYEGLIDSVAVVLPVTPDIAERYAQIFAQLYRKGRPIPSNDIWIAATALAHDLVMVTGDDHFRFIDGLSVEDWSKSDEPGT